MPSILDQVWAWNRLKRGPFICCQDGCQKKGKYLCAGCEEYARHFCKDHIEGEMCKECAQKYEELEKAEEL